jgi:hypothetical protein
LNKDFLLGEFFMRNNHLFLLVFALIAGLSSFAMTFYAARENHESSVPQPPEGLVALNDPRLISEIFRKIFLMEPLNWLINRKPLFRLSELYHHVVVLK